MVTGSRVATGADAPTPVTVVTPDVINQTSIPNIADALAQLPALRSSTTASKGGQGTNIGATLNLRGLGAFRTLVLVDGQRFVPTPSFGTSPSQAVNIDSLPQGLIKRVDTVTGGASAAYGSDAVAGVVNFVLDHNFEGLKGDAGYGETSYGDGIRYNGELTGGAAFNDGKGHIVVDAEYSKDQGIGNDPLGGNPVRPWQSESQTIGRENDGVLGYKIVHNATEPGVPLNGLIINCTNPATGKLYSPAASCPLTNTGFNNAGTATQAYNQGIRNTSTSTFANGGDGYQPGGQSVLDTPSTRYSLFTRVGYDLTSKLNVYFTALSSETISNSQVGSGTPSLAYPAGSAPISVDNAFLPPDVVAAMQANKITSINVNKTFNITGQQIFDAKTTRFTVGGNYQISDNWSADLYYEYGQTSDSLQLNRFTDVINFKKAIDAVAVTPAQAAANSALTAGNVICRSSLTDPGNGCVPFNIFGRTPMTAAQLQYIDPSNNYFNHNSEQVVEGTVKGSPFALPAGPVDIAVGAGYRQENLNNSTDTLGLAALNNPFTNVQGASIYLNQPAIKGSLAIGEVFGEAQVPLLKDIPFAKSLELNLAARYTNYSSSGGVTTWKVGAVWQPIDDIRFRAALSHDVRAANVVELFTPNSTGFASITDPLRGITPAPASTIGPILTGNQNLSPEKANTTTLGVVFNPHFLPGAYASLDFFNIDINGEIGTLSAQQTINYCATNPSFYASYCNDIIRDTRQATGTDPGPITTVFTPYLNLASGHNRGLDLELGYHHELDIFAVKGDFSLRAFSTYTFHNSTTIPGAPATATAKAVLPIITDSDSLAGRFITLLEADYQTGPWTGGLVEHVIGGGRFSVVDPRYPGDTSPSQVTTDISLKRQMGPTWQLYGSVINIFDKDPPHYPFTGPSSGFGTSSLFDTQGRRFEVGAKFKL